MLDRERKAYPGRNTDPQLTHRTGFDERNKELRAGADRWARIPGVRRATDAGWADRVRSGEAMRRAPSAGIAMVDVASWDVVAGGLYSRDVGVGVAGEACPVEDDGNDAGANHGPLANKPPAYLQNEYHGW